MTEGTGIGRVMAKLLAELVGGSLGARSTMGHGSMFTLVVPAASSAHILTAVASRAPARPRQAHAP